MHSIASPQHLHHTTHQQPDGDLELGKPELV